MSKKNWNLLLYSSKNYKNASISLKFTKKALKKLKNYIKTYLKSIPNLKILPWILKINSSHQLVSKRSLHGSWWPLPWKSFLPRSNWIRKSVKKAFLRRKKSWRFYPADTDHIDDNIGCGTLSKSLLRGCWRVINQ